MPPKQQKRKPTVMMNSPIAVQKRLTIANKKLAQARSDVNALTRQLEAVRTTQNLRWRISKLGVSHR